MISLYSFFTIDPILIDWLSGFKQRVRQGACKASKVKSLPSTSSQAGWSSLTNSSTTIGDRRELREGGKDGDRMKRI